MNRLCLSVHENSWTCCFPKTTCACVVVAVAGPVAVDLPPPLLPALRWFSELFHHELLHIGATVAPSVELDKDVRRLVHDERKLQRLHQRFSDRLCVLPSLLYCVLLWVVDPDHCCSLGADGAPGDTTTGFGAVPSKPRSRRHKHTARRSSKATTPSSDAVAKPNVRVRAAPPQTLAPAAAGPTAGSSKPHGSQSRRGRPAVASRSVRCLVSCVV